ncbi:MAG: hypothetical protein A2887_02055 [Alphaproteobacteria bacterium RIFCSPLOWO2_01_FULL_40_26]|nr:MAG: hypothetical protein A3D15_00185 [Alphaproteobacteria bacterium RIFCSPHIGHO2_02_FULL_40_34]OFW87159.1 MAG: hypothetical protein A2794_05415 [Alphaproteobacteria bacterium RIFCSPHIGHO2_01_FULL_40_8]OFW93976.1 MAG: hypothetical protein A2887_02055 [Alphaproteobacteria bacterium RIFCSPLOWO2_01_FULL_40_26]OFX09688.1 MAG: hypothetical protein A3H30_03410 [Alphaproteobacteria bacterium RIFCSPLOWO2_02_FULL_40_19]OFX10837.1 MAG: hypothetical protein A3G22_00475 [Alphaproteobacteria bacterium RI
MSSEMMSLINQAKSQVRTDKLVKFFFDNGRLLLQLGLALIVVAIIFVGFVSWQKANREKFSSILHQSLIYQQNGELDKAKENLKKIVDSDSAPEGIKSLASLRYGAFLLEEGKKDEAAKIYLDVNDCRSCDDYVRELAGLLAVRTFLSDETQKPDLAEHIERVENKSRILRYHIAEQRAFFELQKNNLEKSYQIFEMIAKAPESAQTLKTRAEDGMKIVISKGFQPKE